MIRIKNKEDADYPTLQSENTVRKIPQPMKIAQLLGSSGKLQNGQNSTIKISLPERITPYLKKATNQKKNVTNVRTKLPHDRNVRRNLKFAEIPMSAIKINKFAKANMNNKSYNPKKENLRLSTRKSFLLPPNTIKELHVKNRFKRSSSELTQFRILMNSANVNPSISETSESCSPPMEHTNAHSDSIMHMKKNVISSQMFNVNEQSGINILHSSYSDLADIGNDVVEKISENLNSNEISNVNTCKSQNSDCNVRTNRSQLSSADDMRIDMDLYSGNDVDQNNIHCADRDSLTTCILPDARKVKEACLINVNKKEECLSPTTNIYGEDLHSSLQTVKISESRLNLQHSTNEDERVTLNKAELTILASNLKRLICRLEEDTSNLKLTLTIVTKMLSAINLPNKEIKDNETKTKQQMTDNLNNNTKVTDNMDTKLPCIMPTKVDSEYDNALKETCKTPDINRSKFLKTNKKNPQPLDQTYVASGSNKENKEIFNSPIIKQELKSKTRRRSARLKAKVLNNLNVTNDSFVNLENELDIVNIKSNTPIINRTPLINRTPAKNKYKDKKIARPLKEYMALKSRMSCLLTPNIKRFNSSQTKSNIHCETNDTKTSLSDKLLVELYNLYGDSLDM